MIAAQVVFVLVLGLVAGVFITSAGAVILLKKKGYDGFDDIPQSVPPQYAGGISGEYAAFSAIGERLGKKHKHKMAGARIKAVFTDGSTTEHDLGDMLTDIIIAGKGDAKAKSMSVELLREIYRAEHLL